MNEILKKHPENWKQNSEILSFDTIKREIFDIQKKLVEGKEKNLNERIKVIQEKIHRFAERDISQKQTELLTMALKKVKERLQEVTQGNLWVLKKVIAGGKQAVKKVGEVANRPQEVVQKVQESAGKIVAMGNGNDENPVARWTQWLIRRLLR